MILDKVMVTLTHELFEKWLERYGRYSAENNAQASAELFTQDAQYYENPFAEPLVGREAIYRYWQNGAENLKDKSSSFEILAIKDNLGMARWRSEFTVISSGKRLALDCIFLATFDHDDRCSLFREWWHIREELSNP